MHSPPRAALSFENVSPMRIFVTERKMHSQSVFYPGCAMSRLFARLCNGRQLRRVSLTLTENECRKIQALGYQIFVVKPLDNEGY